MALTTSKPKPDPEAIYEAVQSYAIEGRVYQAQTTLKGDHTEVRARFDRWMLADLPDDEKGKRRAAMWSAVNVEEATNQTHTPPPVARPPAGRFRAVRSWTLADPDLKGRAIINAGDVVDASDELFKRYPHLWVQVIEERS
jgi:hypothetical protein